MSDAGRSAAGPTRLATVENLGPVDARTVAALLTACGDVTLVLDQTGVVIDAAFHAPELGKEIYRDWIGKRWADTATVESRQKISELLRDAQPHVVSRWRQINYPAQSGPDAPMRFAVVRAGPQNRVIAVGRDMQAMAAVQRRLAEAQQAVEREYSRIRSAEKRYRLLFQLTSEPVLIVDLASERVVEINPAAASLIGADARKIVGRGFADSFDASSAKALQSFVAALRLAPRIDNVHVKLASGEPLLLSGSLLRQDNAAFLLVLLTRLDSGPTPGGEQSGVLSVVEKMPDAFVVTDMQKTIVAANAAFVDLAQATTPEQLRGESLDNFLGRPGVDLDVLFATLRANGVVRQFSTVLRGNLGGLEDVDVSGVALEERGRALMGFTMRAGGWRSGPERLGGRELPRTVEQFTDLVGRVPMKNLVRETTDLIERLCIEAALRLTQDNRAAAADMLGLSRQGFYAKLRRYGLGELDDGEAERSDS